MEISLRTLSTIRGPLLLAAEQARLLRRILNRLIPADRKRPGAGDLGGERFIDRAMSASHDLRRHVVGILEAVRREVATSESPDGGSEMDAVLLRAQRDRPESFGVLLDAAYTSYYSDPRVLSALGWVDPSEATSLPPSTSAS